MQKQTDKKTIKPKGKPQETGYIHISEHLKISDPNSKEVFVNKRDD